MNHTRVTHSLAQVVLLSCVFAYSLFAQTNLLLDPGFENDGQGWQRVNNGGRSVVNTEANSGAKSQQMVVSDQWPRQVQQDVMVIAGQSYDAAGWVKTDSIGGAGSMIMLFWLNTTTPGTDYVAGETVRIDTLGVLTGTNAWTQLSGSYTAPNQAVMVRFYLSTDVDSDNSGTTWFDDNEFIGLAPSGLIGYWQFEETSGTTTYDSSGSGNHGTLVGGVSRVSDTIGQAMDFDGVDGHVLVGTNTALDNLTALTFSAWIYPRVDSHWHIIDKGDGDKRLYAEGNSLTLDGRVRDNPTHAFSQAVSSTVLLDTWQHVTMTWSGADNTTRLYHNGMEVTYSTRDVGSGSPLDDSSYPYTIGARGALGAETFFDGRMDEVRIYNRVLSDSEVLGLYQTGTHIADRGYARAYSSPSDLCIRLDPVSSMATIHLAGTARTADIEIFDISGARIVRLSAVQSSKLVFNASGLAGGMYLLRLTADGRVYSKRVILHL